MSRIQLALNVNDIDDAIAFYSTLFDTPPAKRRPGYANFAIENPPVKLVLFENPAESGTLNHVGVERSTVDEVYAEADRLEQAGLKLEVEDDVVCCYARQDKHWVTGPDGQRWENYVVLADSQPELEGVTATTSSESRAGGACCSAAASTDTAEAASPGRARAVEGAAGSGCCS
jgi:catechol 2,3-dioxygenase-like lactoylglutathione lyase family enzyme